MHSVASGISFRSRESACAFLQIYLSLGMIWCTSFLFALHNCRLYSFKGYYIYQTRTSMCIFTLIDVAVTFMCHWWHDTFFFFTFIVIEMRVRKETCCLCACGCQPALHATPCRPIAGDYLGADWLCKCQPNGLIFLPPLQDMTFPWPFKGSSHLHLQKVISLLVFPLCPPPTHTHTTLSFSYS